MQIIIDPDLRSIIDAPDPAEVKVEALLAKICHELREISMTLKKRE